MILYVWIYIYIWYKVWIYDILKLQCKSLMTTAPLQRLLQLVRNEPFKILKSQIIELAIHWRIRPLLLSSAQQPCASTRRENTWTSLALMKSAPWLSVYWLYHTMSHYVTMWLRLAQIGIAAKIGRLSDVGVPHDDGKVGVRVDGRHVGVQRVYERPGSIPAMVFQSCSTLNENICKHHQKV